MSEPDYSFEAQMNHAASNFEEAFLEVYGISIEEARKDPEFVKQFDAQLNRTMWEMGSMPSPFNAD